MAHMLASQSQLSKRIVPLSHKILQTQIKIVPERHKIKRVD
jgi:hypothetical protein